MTDPFVLIFQLLVLLFSVVIHEVSHGAVALMFGDSTARDAGRLTLNPLKHLDPFGSIILPVTLLALTALGGGGIIFGWAKPVPYNPYFFRNPKAGSAIVGFAGPLANLFVAAVFGLGIRFVALQGSLDVLGGALAGAFLSIVYVNLFLAFFNLIPIPPLDGSKLLFAFLPDRFFNLKLFFERYGLALFIFFIFAVAPSIGTLVRFVARILIGA